VPARLMPPMPPMRYVRREQETVGQAVGMAETKGEVRKVVKGWNGEEVIREKEEGMKVTDHVVRVDEGDGDLRGQEG
jgi:hypothetical protein